MIAQIDRYGFPSRLAMCLECGLYYLADRFTDEGYAEFYSKGHYRTLSHAFSDGAGHDIAAIHADQLQYGRKLIQALDGYLRFRPGARLLDIGGSAGHVALEFQKAFQMKCAVLDPADEEVAAARKLGLEGFTGTIEGWESTEKYDMLLFCRSIEHVQDLKGSLQKIRRLLNPGGLLFCDIVDFDLRCHLTGTPEAVSKIDHCYWLSSETAEGVFRAVGLRTVAVSFAFEQSQALVGYLLEACEPAEVALVSPQFIQSRLRTIANDMGDWVESGRKPTDAKDWLRRKAYRMKRRIVRMF
ncbi:MAG: class I SAM-dependent methyltransferase [Candidatus Solibacter sp.]